MKVRYIIDVDFDDTPDPTDEGDPMWLGNDLRRLVEYGWHADPYADPVTFRRLSDPKVGVIVLDKPKNTTAEEFERTKEER